MVFYFNDKNNITQMNISLNCANYFLCFINNKWSMPRIDSDFYKRLSISDQALYGAFYELWIAYCYMPITNYM